jgi:hypothetical protein
MVRVRAAHGDNLMLAVSSADQRPRPNRNRGAGSSLERDRGRPFRNALRYRMTSPAPALMRGGIDAI